MKILQIVNPVIPFPVTTIGGTERVVSYLIDELIKDGHEVTLMGHSDSIVPARVKFIPIGRYLEQENTVKTIWKHLLFNKYDVIHNHGRLIYFLPLIWSNVRKIHTFHMSDLETKSFFRFSKLKARNFTFSPCGRWIQDKTKHLMGNWAFVNNGLPKDLYTYHKKIMSEDSPLIIICRMGKKKGVLDAIKLAKITERNLIIAGKVGDYPEELDWFNKYVLSECNGSNIKFIGAINDEQKNVLLNSALALLIPTIDSEAFNTTMLEANACGCPVISYNRFCFDEYIINGVNGFKGETFEDLISAVYNLNQIDRQICRAFFERNYTAAIMAENYTKLYKSRV
ncbi:glycosyltransferase [Pedobacter changchengzhani]|uniref:Glycosyltransferase n=1 Tax=Pedobacter changchengzhani TaxID=2529274 RepID=A0A4R5MI77_9SPHI|nr:glycosyltransferase [Pedobacter changchengzhani]TDG35290.1 glycosyltransferase [Pedobacter changchengzhani]